MYWEENRQNINRNLLNFFGFFPSQVGNLRLPCQITNKYVCLENQSYFQVYMILFVDPLSFSVRVFRILSLYEWTIIFPSLHEWSMFTEHLFLKSPFLSTSPPPNHLNCDRLYYILYIIYHYIIYHILYILYHYIILKF